MTANILPREIPNAIPEERNLSMLCDFYELTMGNGYFVHGMADTIAVFDLFFRNVPDGGSFAIACGLEQIIAYLQNLRFSPEDIRYLRARGIFSEGFLDYLEGFQFSCDIRAIPEGTPVFPGEPVIRVSGPIIQAQLIETMLLLTFNHQTLIATKANRIVRAADGRNVMEFGSRRAHGYDAANFGARAAYIGGVSSSANTYMDLKMGIPAVGTMAHSWALAFPSELDAFKAYASVYPANCVLLVDTFDTIKSGVPNAIRTARETLEPMGNRLQGIRIDSGDLAHLAATAREMLDNAGLNDCKIVLSNALDEYKIESILRQNPRIDSFGVGENLITARSDAVLGGVYKLAAVEDHQHTLIPKIKISDSPEKITIPAFTEVWRVFAQPDHSPIADYLALDSEEVSPEIISRLLPDHTLGYRRGETKITTQKMLQPVFIGGKNVYTQPSLNEIRAYCRECVSQLNPAYKSLTECAVYPVILSDSLRLIKEELMG